ncbi:small G-protein ras1 [Balamuthia mandrillaris]
MHRYRVLPLLSGVPSGIIALIYRYVTRLFVRYSIVAVHMFCVDLSRPLSSSTSASSDRYSHSSIQTMLSHIQQLQQQNQSNKHENRAHCVLVGTKSDLQPRRVSNEQMGELCEWLNVDRWIETSAKTGEGVEEAFAEALRLAEKERRANRMLENEERTGLPTTSRFSIKERASTMKEDMMTALEMARHFGDVEFAIHQKQEEKERGRGGRGGGGGEEEEKEKERGGEDDKHVSNIPANLVILLCRCPSLIKHMKEGEKQVVIKGVSAEVMRSLFEYIYSKTFPPDLPTDEKHIRQVMEAAKRFEIISLVDGLDEENVVQVIKWSREFALEKLKEACLRYMLRWMHPQSKKEFEKKLDDATRQEPSINVCQSNT